jgi:fructokinase
MNTGPIVGVGEVLWDLLPTGPQAGGAPFNFAFHCRQLGRPAVMVSRVGADERGRALRDAVRALGLSDDSIQEDAAHPTGTVEVSVDAAGQPTFTIAEGVAWDFLAWSPELEALARRADAVCFGTLAQRAPESRQTIRRLLAAAANALVVYDVNLRQHFYDRDIVEASLRAARWVKLNEEELATLRDLLGLAPKGRSPLLAELRRRYDVELAVLTRGEQGCVLQTSDEEVAVPGRRVRVVDTVGAGDAFTAGLLVTVLEGRALAEAAAFANRLAARVAASAGGTPRLDRAEIGAG